MSCDRTVKVMHRLRGRSARCWSCSNIFCLTDPTGLNHAASQVHLVWHASHLILLKTQPQVQTQTGFWLFEATYHFLRRQCQGSSQEHYLLVGSSLFDGLKNFREVHLKFRHPIIAIYPVPTTTALLYISECQCHRARSLRRLHLNQSSIAVWITVAISNNLSN